MMQFRNSRRCVLYCIDRIESCLGNVMIRGWAVSREPGNPLQILVYDENRNPLPVYQERLVREDVNRMFGLLAEEESGFHLLIDRAVLETACIWLVFDNGRQRRKKRIRINESNAIGRFLRERQETPDYDLWIRRQMPDRRERKRQRARSFEQMPLFSVVVPLYNTPPAFLKAMIDSVLTQTYPKLELCLADGSSSDETERLIRRRYGKEKRIRYCRLKKNRGISDNTNAAIRMASGDFLVFADHDDVLAPDALYQMAAAVEANPQTDVIYTDEDKLSRSGNAYFSPHFKPDFNLALLRCNNYICHLFAVRADVRKRAGLLDRAFDGAQDYDYVLRCCECAGQIVHIPKVLYHWRTHQASTAGNPESKCYAFEAGRRALAAHYRRMGIRAEAESTSLLGRYRTRFAIEGEPLVTILIPNRDHAGDLKRCIDSILEKTVYRNFEFLIVENNSEEPETEQLYRALAMRQGENPVRIVRYEGSFNYAAIHNFAVPQANGTYVVLLNNDTEVRSGEWLTELLGLCQGSGVGAVGAKLFYPDDTIQHAGVVLGLCGVASHIYAGCPGDRDGYAARLVSVQEVSAVTAACMMTSRSAWEEAKGMEERLAVAYNDIDYCLRLRQKGYRILFTPYAQLTHYESKTRGYEDTDEKKERLRQEAELFETLWKDVLEAGDPFYNPNLSLTRNDCSLRAN